MYECMYNKQLKYITYVHTEVHTVFNLEYVHT